MAKKGGSKQTLAGAIQDRSMARDSATAKAAAERADLLSASVDDIAQTTQHVQDPEPQNVGSSYLKVPGMRLSELRQQMNELLKQADEHAQVVENDAQIPPSILPALQEFLSFSTDYNLYFWSMPVDELLTGRTTYESVLATALENTRQVWHVLSLAINQRYNPVYKTKLQEIDQQSREMIGRAGSIVTREPIIYFDRIFAISRYPYQTHPVLGIPLDRYRIDGSSALAHELGHHVFWNNGDMAQFDQRMAELSKLLIHLLILSDNSLPIIDPQNPHLFEERVKATYNLYRVWISWLEEVFADSFATLIAGPQFAKASQDILVRQGVSEFGDLIRDDGEHPTPILRPYVALATLRIMADDHPQAAVGDSLRALVDDLEKRWLPIWERGQEVAAEKSKEDKAQLDALKKQVEPVVRAIITADLFTPEQGDAQDETSLLKSVKYWAKEDPDGVEQIQRLRQEFGGDVLFFTRAPSLPTELESRPAAKSGQERPFNKLVAYVRSKRAQEEQRLGQSLNTREWQDILNLQLTLSHNHTGKQTHSHPIYHSHSVTGIDC